ncbi:hypothetical protein HDV03_004275 [Kappamyces sp. JEL0829]|nr:hypothetical protein HDV03_004275 [Kappamyces sp. JEL0829]
MFSYVVAALTFSCLSWLEKFGFLIKPVKFWLDQPTYQLATGALAPTPESLQYSAHQAAKYAKTLGGTTLVLLTALEMIFCVSSGFAAVALLRSQSGNSIAAVPLFLGRLLQAAECALVLAVEATGDVSLYSLAAQASFPR